jgi:hypothetical protein
LRRGRGDIVRQVGKHAELGKLSFRISEALMVVSIIVDVLLQILLEIC